MSVSGHLLILLIPVLSLCEATEYYVRPTEPTNASCPTQPCLTLSQYINDSDHYFQSNTVFRFLMGIHHMDRPLHIGDVYNMTLENNNNECPHMVTQFSCNRKAVQSGVHDELNELECTAVQFHNVHNVTLKGISFTVQAPNISGIVILHASNICIQLNVTHSLVAPYSEIDIHIGILIYDTRNVQVYSLQAENFSTGLQLYNTTNVTITDTTTVHNAASGMILVDTANVTVLNTTTMHNGWSGMFLWCTTRVSIINTTAVYNGYYGMFLFNTTRVSIINTTTVHSGGDGMFLLNAIRVSTINTTAVHSGMNGIRLDSTNRVSIINTTAVHSGMNGICLDSTNRVSIINTTAVHNGMTGMLLDNTNRVSIINTTAMDNGVGMVLLNITRVKIINTTAVYNDYAGMILNSANRTSLISTTVSHNSYFGIKFYSTINVSITKSSVMQNGEITTLSERIFTVAESISLPAAIWLYYSSLHISECHVTRNNISAVKAYASNITVSRDVVISNNTAVAGAAFILIQNSILKLGENSHIEFKNNHAITIGGVFYITDSVYYTTDFEVLRSFVANTDYVHFTTILETLDELITSTCFLSTQGRRSQTKLTFSNNSAGVGGDILYGGHVSYGLDGVWNCLQSFKNVSSISESGLSLIASDPSRVCLCNATGHPDCLSFDSAPHSIYPGQTINISAVVVGQEFGTVAGSTYAQLTDGCSELESGQKIQSVTQDECGHLEYTIYPRQGDMCVTKLILTASNKGIPSSFYHESNTQNNTELLIQSYLRSTYHTSALEPILYSHHPVSVTIRVIPCPDGFMLTSKPPFRCDCNHILQDFQRVKCYIQDQTIGRSGLVWVGTLKNDNATVVASEHCLFDYCNKEDINVTLSYPDSQCNYKHSGTLCGGCQPGLSVALGSAQCLPCSNKYLALLIPFALAGPALVFFIKILDLTISQGTINGLVFYANIVKANEYIFLPQGQTNPLTLFIAWLNLDLGVETCFFNNLTAYTRTWLQFVFPLYIWSIAGLIIILAKYSDRVTKVMGNNSVPVLATVFLLSYAKLFRTIITALSYTMLHSSWGQKAVWSADGNVDYLGPKHAPLFAVAVAALLFLYLPYTLLLFLGQWLHRCDCRLIIQTLMKIKPFLDAHYGPFKGKHHYWFGALLLVRATLLLITALIPTNHANIVNFCVSVSTIVLMCFGFIVQSNITVAVFDVAFFMNLALLCLTKFFTTTSGGNQDVAAYVLVGMAFAQFLGLVLFKIFFMLKKSEKVVACLHKGQPVKDDWELYEQAARQREMHSDIEEEDNDGSGSIESLPTY